MKILTYDQIDRAAWSAFVALHPKGNVFQTPEMYEVYARTENVMPLVLAALEGDEIVGVIVAQVITNGNLLTSWLTARSIITGGPLIKDNRADVQEVLMEAYRKALPIKTIYSEIRPVYCMDDIFGGTKTKINTACAAINIDKEEVTKNAHSTSVSSDSPHGLECNQPQVLTSELAAPVIANTPNMPTDESHVECLQKIVISDNCEKSEKKYFGDWKRKGHYNLVLDVEKSEEELWNGMHKERRRNVGQAEKAGLRFEEVTIAAGRKEVIALLQKTYKRKHVPIADSSLFEHLTEIMPEYVHFFAAYKDTEMIAGQIRLGYKDLLYAWYAGSDEDYFKLRPNDFTMWNVIRWAHEKGYKEFDFGGGGEPGKPYGVRDYKLKYGCEMYDWGRWTCAHRPVTLWCGTVAYKLYHKIKGV